VKRCIVLLLLEHIKELNLCLDKLARYMETVPIEHGRDGNINSLVNAAAKFESIKIIF
jgi:hypothetical protein